MRIVQSGQVRHWSCTSIVCSGEVCGGLLYKRATFRGRSSGRSHRYFRCRKCNTLTAIPKIWRPNPNKR